MIAVDLRFPAGHYHATPWGRNVNEGVPEWPPSPFRLARAVADAAFRRHPDWDEARLEAALRGLEHPAKFVLPPATSSHLRLYQRQGSKVLSDKKLVFDTFVAIEPDARVVALFDAALEEQAWRDLDELLQDINYLGRSESWVQAHLLPNPPASPPPNAYECAPVSSASSLEGGEVVRVACLRPADAYAALDPKPRAGTGRRKRGQSGRPMTWVQALCLSTSQLLKEGWTMAPGMTELDFLLPERALRGRVKPRRFQLGARFTEARFGLYSSVLPRVVDAVPMAERVRRKLMGIHRKRMDGEPGRVSATFSGKTPDGRPAVGHRHAYLLSLDEDHDGRIDHLIVRAQEPFDETELAALDGLRSVWQPGGRPDIQLVLEALTGEPRRGSPHLASGVGRIVARRWMSATPFVTRRHYRKGRGIYEEWVDQEIRRACRQHGLPEPVSLTFLEHTVHSGHPIRWMEFVRNRAGESPLGGHGRILTFAEPVAGPFAIGALAHYGLGLFIPAERNHA